ncbi:MAG: carboxylating nicotinate-nucleotide diphosphorylase [Spirochaetes bacterium]|nr:carboxylating nicotinate-nucleotide diphosphorylase [Spirochaetota bacterium]HPA70931.1 carboxylating nicotinate-nucleotide diphosphorylase [Spirochaetota bacterium]
MIRKADVIDLILLALREDIGAGDITTGAIFNGTEPGSARVVAKEEGVFCAGGIPALVYGELNPSVAIKFSADDGSAVRPGDTVLELSGPVSAILTGERTVLNFLQRMCGIATAVSRACRLLEGTGIRLLDTRKTAPGMRVLDKYAVRTGGGTNHRFGLHDMVMIKDNHIRAAGGIREAVARVRRVHGSKYKIEVEATNLDEVRDALEAGAGIVMLDNMDAGEMARAVELIGARAETEVSGNVTEERLASLRGLGISYISMGSLTHSVKAFDLSMKFL